MALRFHPRIFKTLEGKTHKQARQALKAMGCTKSEQNQILRAAKQSGIRIN